MLIKSAFAQLALRDPKIMDNIVREYDAQSVANMRCIRGPEPRYVPQFVNGIWTIFDRWAFCNREPDLRSYKAAKALLGPSA